MWGFSCSTVSCLLHFICHGLLFFLLCRLQTEMYLWAMAVTVNRVLRRAVPIMSVNFLHSLPLYRGCAGRPREIGETGRKEET